MVRKLIELKKNTIESYKKSLASKISLDSFRFIILISIAIFIADLFGKPISMSTSSFLSNIVMAAFIPPVTYIFGGAWGYCNEVKHNHQQSSSSNESAIANSEETIESSSCQ